MRNVFAPDATYFSDLSADPNVAIHVQQLIQEYQKAEKQRRQGIKKTLEELKSHALPGIVQSTYTLWHIIDKDRQLLAMLQKIIVDLCTGKETVGRFLMRAGIAGNPFPESREWLIKVLSEVETLDAEDVMAILGKGQLSETVRKTSPDLKEFFPLWAKYDPPSFTESLHDAINRKLRYNKIPAVSVIDLINIIKEGDGSLSYIVVDFFDALRVADTAENLEGVKSHPFHLYKSNLGMHLSAYQDVLQSSRHNKNKYVRDSFQVSMRLALECGTLEISEVDECIESYPLLLNYWFMALWGNRNYDATYNAPFFNTLRHESRSGTYAYWLYFQYAYYAEKWDREDSLPAWLKKTAAKMAAFFPQECERAKRDVLLLNTGTGPGSKPVDLDQPKGTGWV
ncbi:hypothetical protein [Pelobacter propionicus]|uniref:Uncharacterized protein n=1 Tax=Pelobacter propionicus (strain DSM 2379 / NBRC 103807 / OttBd1) TaxID=338966 RepID=A1AKC2_PELPD|nr:hypothetical protein [Pelobacter propionicus]ABK97792.1 hypothetical protein Ppro_0156 [Pelobacter propionicus DSM 2379]